MRTILALTALVVLPTLAAADEWNKHWDVPGNAEVHVNVGDGMLYVHARAGGGVDAQLRTQNWTIGPGGVTVEEHLSGNRLDITVREPRSHSGHHSSRLDLALPPGVMAALRTGDGPIKIEGIQGKIDAQTGDGPVTVSDFSGPLDVTTGDGPVELSGRFQDLSVKTGDGPVSVTAQNGSTIQKGWQITTGDGPVTLRVPSDIRANVDLASGDGPVKVDLPLTVQGSLNGHKRHGTLNGGGPELSVRTGDGPISIGRS